jgi:hypothetical protein
MIIWFYILGILAFILVVAAYCFGVKHGRIVASGGQPKLPDPVKKVKNKVEQTQAAKEAEEYYKNLDALFSYSQDRALELMKKGRKT